MRHTLVALLLVLSATAAHAQASPGGRPAYEGDLQRLSEIIGALHYLRDICGAREGQACPRRGHRPVDRVLAICDQVQHRTGPWVGGAYDAILAAKAHRTKWLARVERGAALDLQRQPAPADHRENPVVAREIGERSR